MRPIRILGVVLMVLALGCTLLMIALLDGWFGSFGAGSILILLLLISGMVIFYVLGVFFWMIGAAGGRFAGSGRRT